MGVSAAEKERNKRLFAQDLKHCARCDRTLPVRRFSRSRNRPYGLCAYCKDCQKRYRDGHKAIAAEYNRAYRKTNRKRLREHYRRFRQDNRETVLAGKKRRYEEHKDEILAKQHQYYQQDRLDNPERRRARGRASQQRRRARCARLPADLSHKQWCATLEYFGDKCAYCGAEAEVLHQEHFVPAVAGGGWTAGNIIPACGSCNHQKGTKMPWEWASKEALERIGRCFEEVSMLMMQDA